MSEIFGLHWNGFCSSVVGQVLGSETDELWWLTSVQCGAFCGPYGDELEAFLERFWFKVPAFENSDVVALQPGALSAGAHLMNWDEWAYLLGFSASDEAEAIALAPKFEDLSRPYEIWPHLRSAIHLFVNDFAGGDAAVFTPRRDWLNTLRIACPQSREIKPSEWQQIYEDAEKETQQYLQNL